MKTKTTVLKKAAIFLAAGALANLIGMSWGGFFSTRYAANYPQNVRLFGHHPHGLDPDKTSRIVEFFRE